MKITGLITEYNPFHNGHLYHIKKAKEITGADAVIVIMSGNFVQRGAPAIMPKRLRTEIALNAGVSLVIELPVCYATGSAEYFASGAISILDSLGCIDSICFGSECGDYKKLEHIAKILADEPEAYRLSLKNQLKTGLSFPKARQNGLKEYSKDDSLDEILEHPNNILGIEYIKALYLQKSPIKAYTIKRIVSDYHDTSIKEKYSSASAIRGLLGNISLSEISTKLKSQVPPSCTRLLETTYGIRYPVYSNDFSLLLKYRLLTETKESLVQYMDITEELANRITNHINEFISFEQFCDLLKTKDITYTRISRALLHIILNIRKKDIDIYKEHGYCQYAIILGFRKEDAAIFKHLKNHSSIQLITRLTQIDELDCASKKMAETDIFASNLYESVATDKFEEKFIHERQQSLVIC